MSEIYQEAVVYLLADERKMTEGKARRRKERCNDRLNDAA
jgi:hypothetical protein